MVGNRVSVFSHDLLKDDYLFRARRVLLWCCFCLLPNLKGCQTTTRLAVVTLVRVSIATF